MLGSYGYSMRHLLGIRNRGNTMSVKAVKIPTKETTEEERELIATKLDADIMDLLITAATQGLYPIESMRVVSNVLGGAVATVLMNDAELDMEAVLDESIDYSSKALSDCLTEGDNPHGLH